MCRFLKCFPAGDRMAGASMIGVEWRLSFDRRVPTIGAGPAQRVSGDPYIRVCRTVELSGGIMLST
jgi:hypothetical protein